MKYIIIILLLAFSISSYAQSSGKFKIYKLQSNFINGSPSSIPVGTGEGVAVVDSNGVFVRKVPPSVLGLPTGTVYRIARFTGVNTVTNTTSLVDSAGFYGLGQIDGSGLQNARLNITVQNSSSSGIGLILKNTNGDLFGTIKNTGSFSFGVTSALNWDEVNTKLTANSPFQFGTSTNQPLYFATNGSIRTALDASAFTVNVPVDNTATSYTGLARGTTAERPGGADGNIRYNTTDSIIEWWNGLTWARPGGSATNIYNADGTLAGNRTVTGASHNLTFNGIFNYAINSSCVLLSNPTGTHVYSMASGLGSDKFLELGYTPTPTIFTKGPGVYIDTNNNVGLGVSVPTTIPLYATGNNTYVGILQAGGAVFYKALTITSNTTANTQAYVYLIDATSGNVTVTLPAATGVVGLYYKFKRMDNSGNTITIQRAGSDTIDGSTSFTLTTQYEVKEIMAISTSAWGVF